MNPEGINIYPSKYSVRETTDRLQRFLEEHGATIYARIDQQDELKKTGQTIAALEFLMFGNPKAGGALMAQTPLVALDLPLKVKLIRSQIFEPTLHLKSTKQLIENVKLE